MTREILTYPHPILTGPANSLEAVTDEVRALAEEMTETMYASDGIGLAAPQVGECCRLIVVDISGPERRTELMAIVNPEIVAADGEILHEEGCLSVPNYRAEIRRHERVTVRGLDLRGEEIEVEADGLLAICLQHEIDHLDGTLFIDRISRLKRSLYDKKVKKWQKQKKKN